MFFIVVVNALVPGGTVAWVTRRLGLQKAEPPAPQAVLAIESRLPLEGELLSFYIDEALVVAGVALEDLDFPDGLVGDADRAGQPAGAAARGAPCCEPGDHVYVLTQPEDRAADPAHVRAGRRRSEAEAAGSQPATNLISGSAPHAVHRTRT